MPPFLAPCAVACTLLTCATGRDFQIKAGGDGFGLKLYDPVRLLACGAAAPHSLALGLTPALLPPSAWAGVHEHGTLPQRNQLH